MGGFMKLVDGVQRNYDTVSQGFSQVQDAYDSLQEVKDLLSQQPAEIVKSATSAVITPRADDIARQVVQRTAAATAAGGGRRGGLKRMKSRRKYLKDPKKFKTYISKIRNKTVKKEAELINSIQELKHM